ncbi:DUF2934 domain-containing protein [Rhodoligotrophos defluvii]|uniref:DUF2934 domain-containing protein n=1 Tax=Rhodoligotrophos defluvii TaxID=2561934 RepID=UPI0010C9C3F8|nr:DUF2934 domain-containing protein [Rhodoligotrophos defluvii]
MDDREQRIRERAHALWEQDGRPDGRDQEHWERAAKAIEAEDGHASDAPAPSVSGAGQASGLQPGGRIPGGGPAAGMGSIGAGGGTTANAPTGSARRVRR